MKIKHAAAVALLSNWFGKAAEFSHEKLVERLNQIPEKMDLEDVPEEFKSTYKEIVEAKGQVEIIDGAEKDKPAKEEKKQKTKTPSANGTQVSLAGRSDYVRSLVKKGGMTAEQIFTKTKEKFPTSSRFNVDKIIAAVKKK